MEMDDHADTDQHDGPGTPQTTKSETVAGERSSTHDLRADCIYHSCGHDQRHARSSPSFQVIGTDAGGLASMPLWPQLLCSAGAIAGPNGCWTISRSGGGTSRGAIALPQLQASDCPDELISWLRAQHSPVVILASGDPLWFDRPSPAAGVSSGKAELSPGSILDAVGIRSIGRPWQDATWVSLHGRSPETLANTLQSRPAALAVLTDPGQGAPQRCADPRSSAGGVLCRGCENLATAMNGVVSSSSPLPPICSPCCWCADRRRSAAAGATAVVRLEDGVFLQHPDRPDR